MKLLFLGGPKDGHEIEYAKGFNPKLLPRYVAVQSSLAQGGFRLVAMYGLGPRRKAGTIRARFIGWKLTSKGMEAKHGP